MDLEQALAVWASNPVSFVFHVLTDRPCSLGLLMEQTEPLRHGFQYSDFHVSAQHQQRSLLIMITNPNMTLTRELDAPCGFIITRNVEIIGSSVPAETMQDAFRSDFAAAVQRWITEYEESWLLTGTL